MFLRILSHYYILVLPLAFPQLEYVITYLRKILKIKMQNYYDISVIFLILCLSYNVAAQDFVNCSCDVLRIEYLLNSTHNYTGTYTKQSSSQNINGRPLYISKEENTIRWNQTSKSWDFHYLANSNFVYFPGIYRGCWSKFATDKWPFSDPFYPFFLPTTYMNIFHKTEVPTVILRC